MPKSKITDQDIETILSMVRRPLTQTAVARELGVSVTLVNRIVKRVERGEAPRRKANRTRISDNIFAHCDQSGGPDACWNWLRSSDSDGYGHVWIDGHLVGAHRLSYEIVHGRIPNDKNGTPLQVRHKCDNPTCINPKHLMSGTILDNVLDREERFRGRQPVGGEGHGTAKLKTRDIMFIRRCKDLYNSREMAEMLHVKQAAICKVLRGDVWKHVIDDNKPHDEAAMARAVA